MHRYEEAVRQHFAKLVPLSMRIEDNLKKNPLPVSPLLDSASHRWNLTQWCTSMRRLENQLIDATARRWDTVPAIAPVLIMDLLGRFMSSIMDMGSEMVMMLKLYVHMFGAKNSDVADFADRVLRVAQANLIVAGDTLLASISTAHGDKPPVFDKWTADHEDIKKLWMDTVGAGDKPDDLGTHILKFQHELTEYVKARRPDIAQRPAPSEEDIAKFASETGVPVETLKGLLKRDPPAAAAPSDLSGA